MNKIAFLSVFCLLLCSTYVRADNGISPLVAQYCGVWQPTNDAEAVEADPPGRRRKKRRSYLTYKGLDFTLSGGVALLNDTYTFGNATAYQRALETAFTPTLGNVFTAHLELPLGKYFRLGTGFNLLTQKRSFVAPEGIEVEVGTPNFQSDRSLQIPFYLAFDQHIRRFSVGVSGGIALQAFRNTVGARLYEDLRAAQFSETTGDPYYNDEINLRPFAEFRLEYRPVENFGIVARIGHQFAGPNELTSQSTAEHPAELKTRVLQMRIGVNYALLCNDRRRRRR